MATALNLRTAILILLSSSVGCASTGVPESTVGNAVLDNPKVVVEARRVFHPGAADPSAQLPDELKARIESRSDPSIAPADEQ